MSVSIGSVSRHLIVFIMVAMLFADIGSGRRAHAAVGDGTTVSFSVESPLCSAWYPIRIDQVGKVSIGSSWWRGRADASLVVGLGFTTSALLLEGEFLDDVPFQQGYDLPYRPDGWGLPYAADGLEFSLEDPTSASRRVHFVINLSSGAIQPRLDLLQAMVPGPTFLPRYQANPALPGTVAGAPVPVAYPAADISLFDGFVPEDGDEPTIRFQVAIPMAALSTVPLGRSPLRVTVRLHDLDGDTMRYKMLEDTVETR